MLRPISTNKKPAPHTRLWFCDPEHDLFIWVDKNNHPISFQLSYRTYSEIYSEHIISWNKEKGFSHDKIDDGEHADGDYKMTPIMVPDGVFDSEKIAERFKSISTDIDEDIMSFVYQKLCDYPTTP